MFKGSRKEIRLYNVIFPVWILMLFPLTWFLVIPANFVIDSLILLLGMLLLKVENKLAFYKKYILWVFLFGFLSDIIGGIMLLITQFFGDTGIWYEYITAPVAQNPFDNVYSLLYTLAAVAVSAVLIYVFNRFVSFRKCKKLRTKRVMSLLLAVLTAPYLFLLPTTTLYGGQTDSFTNHIVWSDYLQAELYLAEEPEKDILAVETGEHFNYSLVSSFRQGINCADRTDDIPDGDWDYKIIFYKKGKEVKYLDEILFYEYGGNLYFSFDNKNYRVKSSDKEYIIRELSEELDPAVEEVENE